MCSWFTGEFEICTEDINECDPNPCVNNASCVDSIINYTYVCMAGYDGRNCQINIDDCQPNPCFNGGICMDSTSKFSCMCPPHILDGL